MIAQDILVAMFVATLLGKYIVHLVTCDKTNKMSAPSEDSDLSLRWAHTARVA